MSLHRAVAVLNEQKELLEQVLDLAACQLDLIESDRIEDLEILLSLRAKPMTALANLERDFGREMFPAEADFSPNDLQKFEALNIQIIILSNQIAEIDKKTERLAEQYFAFGKNGQAAISGDVGLGGNQIS